MSVVDTGVVLALLDADHARHEEAKRLLETGPISLTPPTLTEATRIIRRHANERGGDGNLVAREALQILRSLSGYRAAAIPPEEEVAGVYDRDAHLSYADAWNLFASLQGGEPLATFDTKLQRARERRRPGRRARR